MKRILLFCTFLLLGLFALALAANAQQNGELDRVLSRMDATADAFKTTQADFVWDQYQRVVDEHDQQKGTVYFRRNAKGTEMAADIKEPDKKYVLFSEGKVQMYQPSIEQVTQYSAGKNREAFESFLVLGFGGRGHDLVRQFGVKYLGTEMVDGIKTAKLELTPKQPKVASMFSRILLWIDPARGVSVQQQFFEPSGDYRLAKYMNIKMNERLPDSAFKLKTTSKTKIVSPQG